MTELDKFKENHYLAQRYKQFWTSVVKLTFIKKRSSFLFRILKEDLQIKIAASLGKYLDENKVHFEMKK